MDGLDVLMSLVQVTIPFLMWSDLWAILITAAHASSSPPPPPLSLPPPPQGAHLDGLDALVSIVPEQDIVPINRHWIGSLA